MKIHYQKDLGSPDKIISDVIYVGIVDRDQPASVVLADGKELSISLDHMEAIVDDAVFDNTIDAPVEKQPGGSTNFDMMRSMAMEHMAMTMMCPNETGLGMIECDQADDRDCFACCMNWLKQPVAKCRICGCTAITPCLGGCSWAEPDLCSRCAIADAFQRRRGPDISITPHKPGDGGILCMPMVANIPEPGRADWRLMDCPVCGRECWQSDAHRQALAAEPGLQAACTMCALRAGMRRGKEDANDE